MWKTLKDLKISTDAAPIINVVISSERDLRETTKVVEDRIKRNLDKERYRRLDRFQDDIFAVRKKWQTSLY